jgi:hypothetical protein
MEQPKEPFRKPELTEFGRLSVITAHHKITHQPPGNAWGLYKTRDELELELYSQSS